jgi:hypothetical protein
MKGSAEDSRDQLPSYSPPGTRGSESTAQSKTSPPSTPVVRVSIEFQDLSHEMTLTLRSPSRSYLVARTTEFIKDQYPNQFLDTPARSYHFSGTVTDPASESGLWEDDLSKHLENIENWPGSKDPYLKVKVSVLCIQVQELEAVV